MRKLRRSIIAYLVLGVGVFFVLFSLAFSWYEMQELSSALVISSSLILLALLSVPAVKHFREGRDDFDFAIVAIYLLILFTFGRQMWINVVRWLDRPDWMTESYASSIPAISIALALFLLILARNTEHGMVPKRNMYLAIAGVVMAIFITMATLCFFPQ